MEMGVVMKSTGSWYDVRSQDGKTVKCKIRGKIRLKGLRTTNPVAVGDKVRFEMQDEETGVITGIEPRMNYIVRRSVNLSRAAHILAANIDQALLLVTLKEPLTLPAFVDRFLVTAEAYHIPAVLIFNKIDIYSEAELDTLRGFASVYWDVGYRCLEVSAETGEGLETVRKLLANKVSLLSGHSGVGKSTLANAVDSGLKLRTAALSESFRMGQHTTTFAEMHPLSFGGYVIDTPGIKGFGLVDFEKTEIAERFPEMRALMSGCKSHNCVHVDEPQCAVKEAVEDGRIAWTRYDSYLKLYFNNEAEDTYRQNPYS